jgi:hypothetical protein
MGGAHATRQHGEHLSAALIVSPACWDSLGSTEISGGSAVRKVDDMSALAALPRCPPTCVYRGM